MTAPAGLPSQALLAAAGGVVAAKPTPAKILKQSDLAAIEAAAIQRWKKAGATAAQVKKLKAISFQIADLGGSTLGLESGGNKVVLDDNAAGYGWYVDSTPMDDKEFTTVFSKTRIDAKSTAAPAGQMDLLTVVMHEMGHILGLDSFFALADREGLMYAYLTTGERRLPMRITALR